MYELPFTPYYFMQSVLSSLFSQMRKKHPKGFPSYFGRFQKIQRKKGAELSLNYHSHPVFRYKKINASEDFVTFSVLLQFFCLFSINLFNLTKIGAAFN